MCNSTSAYTCSKLWHFLYAKWVCFLIVLRKVWSSIIISCTSACPAQSCITPSPWDSATLWESTGTNQVSKTISHVNLLGPTTLLTHLSLTTLSTGQGIGVRKRVSFTAATYTHFNCGNRGQSALRVPRPCCVFKRCLMWSSHLLCHSHLQTVTGRRVIENAKCFVWTHKENERQRFLRTVLCVNLRVDPKK